LSSFTASIGGVAWIKPKRKNKRLQSSHYEQSTDSKTRDINVCVLGGRNSYLIDLSRIVHGVPVAGGIEPFEFELYECPMTTEQGGGFYEDGRAKEPTRTQEERTQPEEEAIAEAKVRGASSGSTRNQELMFEKTILRHERLGSVRPEEFAQASYQMNKD